MASATGPFDVSLTPTATDGPDDGVATMSLDKTYRGDLEGTAQGAMLAHTTSVDGSAGYVALERVEGTLHGRFGTFVLQHHGVMDRGEAALTVTVVPDSATGELAGLRGEVTIAVAEDGAHTYTFDYELPVASG